MSSNTPRYLIGSTRSDPEAIKSAFREVLGVCRQCGIGNLTLLVPTKKAFPDRVVGRFLGQEVSKDLCDKKTIAVSDDLSMNLESVNTFQPYGEYGMVMGIHLSARGIDLMDSTVSASAIVFLPWTEEEGKAWLETWNPVLLGKSDWQATRAPLPDEIADALQRITSSINLSTGLSHPSDKAFARRVLQDLRSGGLKADREEIRSWALRNGWHPRSAEELAVFCERYL